MLAPLWLCALAAAVEWSPPRLDLAPRPGVYRWLVQSDDPDLRERLRDHLLEAGAELEPDQLPYNVFSVPAGKGRALASELRRHGRGRAAFLPGRRCPRQERARVLRLLEGLEPELPGLADRGRLLESIRRLAEAWADMLKSFEESCAAAEKDLLMVGLSDRAPAPEAEIDSMGRPVGPPMVPPDDKPGAPYPDWEAPTATCGWPDAVLDIRISPRQGQRAAYLYEMEEGLQRLGLTLVDPLCAKRLVEIPDGARLAAAMAGEAGLARVRSYAERLGWAKETIHRVRRDLIQPTPASRWYTALKAELAEEASREFPNARSLAKHEAGLLAQYDVPAAPGKAAMVLLVVLP